MAPQFLQPYLQLAVRRANEAVLGTFAAAVREIGALTTVLGQALVLNVTELHLRAGKNQVVELAALDVAETTFRMNIVIARVNASVMFDGDTLTERQGRVSGGMTTRIELASFYSESWEVVYWTLVQ